MSRTPANAQTFLATFPPTQFDADGGSGSRAYLRDGSLTSPNACTTSITGRAAHITQDGKRVPGGMTKVERRIAIGLRFRALTDAERAPLGIATGQGIFVEGFQPGLPAENAGLRAGDVITAFNQQPLIHKTFADIMGAQTAGSSMELTVVRKSKSLTLTVMPALHDVPTETLTEPETFTIDWSRVIGVSAAEGSPIISILTSTDKGQRSVALYYETPSLRDRMAAAAQYLQQACDKTKGLGF